MKIATWNVNSINARIEHLTNFIKTDQSDIYLIQELKCTEDNFPYDEIKSTGYNTYVNELIGSSFKITNPQASSSCGCGTSFSI